MKLGINGRYFDVSAIIRLQSAATQTKTRLDFVVEAGI